GANSSASIYRPPLRELDSRRSTALTAGPCGFVLEAVKDSEGEGSRALSALSRGELLRFDRQVFRAPPIGWIKERDAIALIEPPSGVTPRRCQGRFEFAAKVETACTQIDDL